MKSPPLWSHPELTAEAAVARGLFRDERLQEPLARWQGVFANYRAQFTRLFDEFGIADPSSLTAEKVVEIFEGDLGDALRYLAGPPISEDDLKVLAEASLAPSVLRRDPTAADRILETILVAIDPTRFPWLQNGRQPTQAEKKAAILASAALITAQRVSTDRRTEGKEGQEAAVKAFLTAMGFTEVAARTINTLADAPGPRQFCAESMVGSRKADIPVRLDDGRLMPIECKVSNSSTNSVKRINNDAAVKARIWKEEFGRNQVVPVAVLSGVFKVLNLEQAQAGGLTLFWAHKLGDMNAFIQAAQPGAAP